MKSIEKDLPEYIHVKWSDRKCGNQTLRIVYCAFKYIYVSAWFYYVPFVTIFLSYYLPYSQRDAQFDVSDCPSEG